MDGVDEFYTEWIDGIAAPAKCEPAQEAALEARLYDAFLRLPTLRAKQNAVVMIEIWAKEYADRSPDKAA